MIKCDLHMHTLFCDGTAEPEEYICAAIEKGLDQIGFSVHSYVPFDTECCIAKERISEYKAEIRALKIKYSGKISVLCGVEQDYYSEFPTDGFDYVIGSVHYYKTPFNTYIPFDISASLLKQMCADYFDGDIYLLCDEYYRLVADVVRKTGADIIGHFDLIGKFCEQDNLFDFENARYVESYTKAAKKLSSYSVPFEINTGAISRKYRTIPYPSKEITKLLVDLGARFVMSSDAHSPENIAYEFEKYEAWAKNLGAEFVW